MWNEDEETEETQRQKYANEAATDSFLGVLKVFLCQGVSVEWVRARNHKNIVPKNL